MEEEANRFFEESRRREQEMLDQFRSQMRKDGSSPEFSMDFSFETYNTPNAANNHVPQYNIENPEISGKIEKTGSKKLSGKLIGAIVAASIFLIILHLVGFYFFGIGSLFASFFFMISLGAIIYGIYSIKKGKITDSSEYYSTTYHIEHHPIRYWFTVVLCIVGGAIGIFGSFLILWFFSLP